MNRNRLNMGDALKEALGYHLSELDDSQNHTSRSNRRSPPNRSPGRGSKGTVSPTTNIANTATREDTTVSYTWRDTTNSSKTPAEQPLSPSPLFGVTGFRATAVGARSESELKQKIQALEDTVADYERQKFNVMGTFAEYRERVAERERKLEAEYSTKIISLSEEVLGAKKDFEERMKQFQALQEKFEREKEGALEKLRQEHQKEIQSLERRCSDAQLMHLEQKYMVEIQRLEEERKSLKAEKERLGEAFESKLRRAQSLYETELSAAKALYTKELEALKDHEDALKEELFARQDEFRDRLSELQHQFLHSKEELERCKKEVAELEERLKLKEQEVAAISQELHEARLESDECLDRLSRAETELEDTRKHYEQQKKELQKKISLLEKLEAAKTHLETLCQDLQVEVRSLRSKCEFLQNERQNLESQSESQAQLQDSQVHALEAVLENLTKERDNTKSQFENMLEIERVHAEEREYQLKKEFTGKLTDLEKQHKSLQENLDCKIKEERDMIRKKLMLEHDERLKELRMENESLEEEIISLRARLHCALDTNSNSPDAALNVTVQQEMLARDKIIKDTKEQLHQCHSKTDNLSKELKDLQAAVESKDEVIDKLREEIEAMKEQPEHDYDDKDYKGELKEIQARLESEQKTALSDLQDKLNAEFELKRTQWNIEKVKLESKIQNLTRSKLGDSVVDPESGEVEELQTTIVSLNATIEELNNRIQDMEDHKVGELSLEYKTGQQDAQKLQSEFFDTREELEKYADEHVERIEQLEKQIKQRDHEIKILKSSKNIDKDEIERELRSKFAEAAAENHVADVEAFEKQLQVIKEQAEEREKEQDERACRLQKELTAREVHIEKLHKRVQELTQEIECIVSDLNQRSEELTQDLSPSDNQEQIDSAERDPAKAELIKKQELLAKQISSINERAKQAVKIGKIGDREAESNLKRRLSEKEAEVKRLQKELERHKGCTKNASPPIHDGCGRDHCHRGSDNRKPSISSTGSAPARSNGSKRGGPDLNIVQKWHCLVDQLKQDGKEFSRHTSTKKLCRSGACEKGDKSETVDGSEASSSRSGRSLSRSAILSSSQSTLKPPDVKRQGKSPTRPGFLSKQKSPLPPPGPGSEKRPAWRF